MDNRVLEKVFEYDNYRFFLRDYFREMKRLKSCFSHRYFAMHAGFSSSSFCAHVIEGKRNLTSDSMRKVMKGLGLSGKAASYFETLVSYNQAKTIDDREHYFRLLERLRKSTAFYHLHQKQFAYYDEWYYPVIRELATHAKWDGDFAKLGRMVRPAVLPDRAREAVDVLVEVGLLERQVDGSYRQTAQTVSAQDVPSAVTRKARKEFILRALEAMERLPAEERHIAGATVAMSDQLYRQVVAKLDELRKEILEAAMDEETVDGVYHINLQAFPLSTRIEQRPRSATGGEF
jgi:uncharacterized protein (TIGR02147 family)